MAGKNPGYWRREKELADALAEAAKGATEWTKAIKAGTGAIGSGGGGKPGTGGGPGGSAGGTAAGGAAAPPTAPSVMSNIASFARGSAIAAAGATVAIGAKLATAGLTAAARGQDVSAGISFAGDQIASNIPFFGEAANKRVSVGEGVLSDLNALTNPLAAQGYNTNRIRERAAPIFQAQQERVYADQNDNADVAMKAVESSDTIDFIRGYANFLGAPTGPLVRSVFELFNGNGIHGAK